MASPSRRGAGGPLFRFAGHRSPGRSRISAPAVEGRRRGDLYRLGRGRDPSRQLRREGARQGRLAGPCPRRSRHATPWRSAPPASRDARGHGPGKAWPDPRGRSRRHRRRRRRRIGRRRTVLSKLGHDVIASTGRLSEPIPQRPRRGRGDRPRRASGPAKPLAKERWAGGIDSVGSTTLANLLSMTKYAAPSPPAALPPAWTCRRRWPRLFYAECAFSASIP